MLELGYTGFTDEKCPKTGWYISSCKHRREEKFVKCNNLLQCKDCRKRVKWTLVSADKDE